MNRTVLERVLAVASWRDHTVMVALRPHRRMGIQVLRDLLRRRANRSINAIPTADRNVR